MMIEQLGFAFVGDEFNEIKGLAKRSYKAVRKKYPPVPGETMEDWRNFIVTETLLEIAARLEEIALRRQKTEIDLIYGEKNDR